MRSVRQFALKAVDGVQSAFDGAFAPQAFATA
jgi:hypothetical protein